jgi:hypothetical protein
VRPSNGASSRISSARRSLRDRPRLAVAQPRNHLGPELCSTQQPQLDALAVELMPQLAHARTARRAIRGERSSVAGPSSTPGRTKWIGAGYQQ